MIKKETKYRLALLDYKDYKVCMSIKATNQAKKILLKYNDSENKLLADAYVATKFFKNNPNYNLKQQINLLETRIN